MTPILRRILGGVAIVGALASVVAGRERPTLDLRQPRAAASVPGAAIADLELDRLTSRTEHSEGKKGVDPSVDPFAPRSFSGPEAAVAAQPAKPQKPVAPPLPFRYLGKMLEDGKLNVFLSRGDESLSVHAGQKLGEYRVDKVTDSEIVFTYLPLKTKQSLPL
jgi:Tfp pilus assembly protein PilP